MPRLPTGVRVYAIGDIHGRIDLLDEMVGRIDLDIRARRCFRVILVFLGDYVDRGPASAMVIDRLIQVRQTHQAVCLKGNHDSVFKQFLAEPGTLPAWVSMGGLPTLMSYGLEPPLQPKPSDGEDIADRLRRVMPDSHDAFLDQLPPLFQCGDYAFVHAGIKPNVPLARQSEEDLLWIRDEFLTSEAKHEKIIVHGHTPVVKPEIHANRINIDTGAFATGRLTCLVLEDRWRHFL